MPHTLTVACSAIALYRGAPLLRPVRLEGHEGMSSLFAYELLLESVARIPTGRGLPELVDIGTFVNCDIRCQIALEGQDYRLPKRQSFPVKYRQINAMVSAAVLCGQRDGHAQYRLTLRPWLYRATLNTDCRIFQKRSVDEIIFDVLRSYSGRLRSELGYSYPARDYQVQYNETDFAFVERLCQEWGINYHFEHADGLETLVLQDHRRYPRFHDEEYHIVEFHPPGFKAQAEHLQRFSMAQELVQSHYDTDDYDYTRPYSTLPAHGSSSDREGPSYGGVFEWHGGPAASHYAQPKAPDQRPNDPHAEGEFLAMIRIETLRTARRRAQASGNLRAMVPGCTFQLTGHGCKAANIDYLVLDTRFLIEDTAQEAQRQSDGVVGRWRVHVDFTAHPVKEPLRPLPTRAKPHTHGPQPAIVSGPKGLDTLTDEYGRIKVRFFWDRADHGDECSSCWVRVAAPWAGAAMGMACLPRIGQEVLIDFIGGDPDLPICIGSLHNARRQPSWEMPQDSLAGLRSSELMGYSAADKVPTGRINHLLLDDTRGEMQAQLRSDQQHSQLSLGHIVRIENWAGRKEKRGEGMELRTDGHGAVRAGLGLLLSTHARKASSGGIKELQETRELLARALEQLDAHARGAVDLQIQDMDDQGQVARALHLQHGGIVGASPLPMGEFNRPHLVVASPVGVVLAAGLDVQLAAGGHVALNSVGHTSISTGGSLLASAARAVRLLAHRGMRLFAAHGDLEIQAQNDALRMGAKQTAELASTEGWVEIKAKLGIRLSVGGSCFEVTAAGITSMTDGAIAGFAAGHTQGGPRNRAVHLNDMPTAAFDDRYRVVDQHGKTVSRQAWEAGRADGVVPGGESAGDGRIDHQRSDAPDAWVLKI